MDQCEPQYAAAKSGASKNPIIFSIWNCAMKRLSRRQGKSFPIAPEPLVVIFNEGGHGGYLDGIGIVGGILKKTVIRVEQFPRDEKKELSGGSSVVQAVFAVEGQKQLGALQIFSRLLHDLVESVC